ncbi:putative receptor protein kinase ZmPK1 isoform X1 [Quercus robur]|uniref:putative receptor protein kinase ZmPK1 isoform X1 n=1 Tax=Quercus robur TaxID=38942 RepID=UPI0021633B67|nr:putative receptor protein kinase ZmPK1 isoform X1 [Quercus robur]
MTTIILLLLSLTLFAPFSSSTFSKGSSLVSEKPTYVLTSPDNVFSAGFYSVGENAFCFAIWFSNSSTIVWVANRDQPVNGKRSKLSLLKNGNLILTDAGKFTVWATNTFSLSLVVQLSLYNAGNLVLQNTESVILWQSFDFPTNTLLPQQLLSRNTKLVSSRSQTNHSSGFYELFFYNNNVLSLLFNGPEVSSIYWPEPWLVSWEAKRSTYNNSRIAVLNSLGNFSSSDDFTFLSNDYGAVLHRRLTLDYDGNIRLYSWEKERQTWVVSWQANQKPCRINGVCGANSLCKYVVGSGRKCSCPPGYKMKDSVDWSYGCEPKFDLSHRNKNESVFLLLSNVEFYGYDVGYYSNYSFDDCTNSCLQLHNCNAVQYAFETGDCFCKSLLLNGYHSPDSGKNTYLRLPKSFESNKNLVKEFSLDCSREGTIQLDRTYVKNREKGIVKFLLWFACGVGGLELTCIFVVWCLLIKTRKSSDADNQGYGLAATRFRKFTYAELKKATNGFTEEIGIGAWGVVYKGVLSDSRVAAIKRLNEANQGEDEFLAEVSIIGRLNHMNLIDMWGYCAEGKHRLLVYEYMMHGSLAENLSSNALDWKQRFEIALGTAKGLAYLHEECLEWVLHCDIKPQNILLDSNYEPKVADFGLSKLQNRGVLNNPSFSRMRGTRGYMAPEWVFNLPITSKVDVYSYGIVVLEMVTGKNTIMGVHTTNVGVETKNKRLATWVKGKKNGEVATTSWIDDIMDPKMEGIYDKGRMEILVEMALQCLEEDKDERPTMKQVVEKLSSP